MHHGFGVKGGNLNGVIRVVVGNVHLRSFAMTRT
jgi:hypothetical protein